MAGSPVASGYGDSAHKWNPLLVPVTSTWAAFSGSDVQLPPLIFALIALDEAPVVVNTQPQLSNCGGFGAI